MKIYRYQSFTPYTVKGLLYDELFFAYPEELNDPIDGKVTFRFHHHEQRWVNLLTLAWGNIPEVQLAAKNLMTHSKITISDLIDTSLLPFFLFGIERNDNSATLNNHEKTNLSNKLSFYVSQWIRADTASVSFSYAGDNNLMWSHYAGKHEGFCLIFRDDKGHLNQCPMRKRDSVSRTHFSRNMQSKVPLRLKFEEVIYVPPSDTDYPDAFILFPAMVYGEPITEAARTAYWEKVKRHQLTKNENWAYEKEARLILHSSEHQISPNQRLFHYNFGQLVGVIFGMRMSNSRRDQITEILCIKSEQHARSSFKPKWLPDIILNEAVFDSNNRMTFRPTAAITHGRIIERHSDKFDYIYKQWGEDKCLYIDESGSISTCS
ncbi:DUF2971 domain-containing protein [Pantoea brenneri]|uniref:DUF2971 domain-containing protein n=1 Tax=Siphoviridae sp. ct4sp3 TaxID=2825332 RepID=A0A8S5PSA0_9CAUD|nr:DUF2971 domain-containing protein [Pantoea brenneri]DAE10031.1 MAG TPA: Protein of unknown function (DUF2971) [Siphoviridae sp. ct4sp3]